MKPHILTRLDTREIPHDPSEVRAFGVLYNEMYRLPSFLNYYRSIGVKRFFLSDNASTDGTREYLLTQPDCHVFYSANSYAEAKSGIRWTKALLDLYGTDHWCITLDADELLVYPHSETISLPEFCAFLDQEGSDGIYTFMMDMYPKDSIANAVLSAGQSMFEVAPYYDKDYRLVDRTRLKGEKPFPPKEMLGGPRTRCFYPGQEKLSYRQRWIIHLCRRITFHLQKRGFPIKELAIQSPVLNKVPLVKWKKRHEYIASTHLINPIKLSKVTGVLAHFKFFADFHGRVAEAVKKGEHAQGGAEYKRYLERMDQVGSLMYEGSTYYKSSQDLVNLNLLQTTPAYEAYVHSIKKVA